MTTPGHPAEPRARASHRAPPKPRSFLVPIVVGAAVLAAIGLATWMLLTSGDGGTPTTSPKPTGPTHGTPTHGTPTPSKTGTHRPTHSATPTHSASTTPTSSPTSSHTQTQHPSTTPVPNVGVYVFNQTTVTGAAAALAATMQREGWRVLGVDNWIGHVPENTVYYWPGDQAAAERLSHDFAQIGRVWPATSPMPRDGLVVILAGEPPK